MTPNLEPRRPGLPTAHLSGHLASSSQPRPTSEAPLLSPRTPPPRPHRLSSSPGLSLCVSWRCLAGGLTLRGELMCCLPASCQGLSAAESPRPRTGAVGATQPVSGRGVRAGVYTSHRHEGASGAGGRSPGGLCLGGAHCREETPGATCAHRRGWGLPRCDSCSAFSQLPPSSWLPTRDRTEFA